MSAGASMAYAQVRDGVLRVVFVRNGIGYAKSVALEGGNADPFVVAADLARALEEHSARMQSGRAR